LLCHLVCSILLCLRVAWQEQLFTIRGRVTKLITKCNEELEQPFLFRMEGVTLEEEEEE